MQVVAPAVEETRFPFLSPLQHFRRELRTALLRNLLVRQTPVTSQTADTICRTLCTTYSKPLQKIT
jgi:hypothetical protein